MTELPPSNPAASRELLKEVERLNAESARLMAQSVAMRIRAEAMAKEAEQLSGQLRHERGPQERRGA